MRTPSLILLLVLAATPAYADRGEPVVLAVDGKDIYVDLGARDGVGAGAQLELLHEVVATDPTTGKPLRDRFALGTLAVARAGEATSIAHADDELARRVLAGDRVRLVGEPRPVVDPWQAQVDASKAAAAGAAPAAGPPIDHAALARDAWQATLGQPPEARIEVWQQLLARDPQSTYRRAIESEIRSQGAQLRARDAALARARTSSEDRGGRIAELAYALAEANPVADPALARGLLAVAPIEHVAPDHPLDLAFLVRVPHKVERAFLYARTRGEVGFHRTDLVRDGDAYLRGVIPAELVREPGLEWYVEVAPPGADARPVLGSHELPYEVAVARSVGEPPPQAGRSHVDLHVDYVDFDGRLSKGYDQYYQAEADFGYRFLDPVYAVRLGFGTLSGIGGPKAVIDTDPRGMCTDAAGVYQCKRVDFSYVYTELEYRFRTNVALLARPQIGVLTTDTTPGDDAAHCQSRDTTGCRFLTGLGGRIRLRLGEEQATNLVLGAGFTRGVGTLLEAAYHWLPAPVVPVQITVQVTDQPVIDDFGVRLIGDVGYRRLGWFYPSLRVSYQARALDHTGVSGGMAMNFDW